MLIVKGDTGGLTNRPFLFTIIENGKRSQPTFAVVTILGVVKFASFITSFVVGE
jgi:hypothetical protein